MSKALSLCCSAFYRTPNLGGQVFFNSDIQLIFPLLVQGPKSSKFGLNFRPHSPLSRCHISKRRRGLKSF